MSILRFIAVGLMAVSVVACEELLLDPTQTVNNQYNGQYDYYDYKTVEELRAEMARNERLSEEAALTRIRIDRAHTQAEQARLEHQIAEQQLATERSRIVHKSEERRLISERARLNDERRMLNEQKAAEANRLQEVQREEQIQAQAQERQRQRELNISQDRAFAERLQIEENEKARKIEEREQNEAFSHSKQRAEEMKNEVDILPEAPGGPQN